MGVREIVGAGVTGFILVYVLYFIIPATRTAYTNELSVVNQSSAIMQSILPFTNGWWIMFPALIVVAGGYTIWSYFTDRDPFDYS